MNLIIVESPTKAKTLGKFLGKDYKVEATIGHIKDLPKSPISVDIEHDFKPDYQYMEKQAETIKKIKSEGKKADRIFLATDPDREGEAISAHVKEILETKVPIKRIVFHEITKEAVEHAIAEPRDIDKCMVDAQIARRVLDRLVGYKLSPILWKKVRRGLSAGRVQSVAVRLIAEREREIEAYKPIEYWEIGSDVKKHDSFYIALARISGKTAEVHNKKQAEEIVSGLKKNPYVVSKITKKEVKASPYAPFTTATMTQAGARIFGWSAKKTMSVAQKLYEEGTITYHRTDSVNIAASAQAAAKKFILEKYGDKYYPESPRFYKNKSKRAQEAHEAVRPTTPSKESADVSGKFAADANKLYKLIWSRFIASQMSSSISDRTTIDVECGKYTLRTTGSIIKFDGFRKVWSVKSLEDVILPDVSEGDKLTLIKVRSEQKFTEPPARYNEASIIKKLEELGIGRPSTYAPIISTIQHRKYVEKSEGRFVPTTVGLATNDFLVKNFKDIVDYDFTAEMEDDLDKVADGKIKWNKRIKIFWGPFEKTLKDVEKNAKRIKIPVEKLGKKCPDCKDGELVIRMGRFGKFISCSTFPECKYTEKYVDKIGMSCPECKTGDVIIKKTKKGRPFFGCSRYPECEYASWTDPKNPKKKEEKEVEASKDE